MKLNNNINENNINKSEKSETQNCNGKKNDDSGSVETSDEKVDQGRENINECPDNCDGFDESLDPNKPTLDSDKTSQKNINSTENNSVELIVCPVCHVNIPGVNLNIHIDNCSKREAITDIHTT